LGIAPIFEIQHRHFNIMSETVVNPFLYVEGGVVKSLGAVAHDFDGTDDQKIVAFLQSQVDVDANQADRYPLPVAGIKSGLGVDATEGLSFEMFSYLARTGNALRFFEGPLQAVNAPESPCVCITPIVDGKPLVEVGTHLEPLTSPAGISEEFDGIVKQIDYLGAYVTTSGLNVHDLLFDDFTKAIKLLYENKHYVSAMKLIVSFIDTLAYLEFGDMARNYVDWLTKYAALAPVGVTPSELWEFRNAMLHMTNPLSRKVMSGKVPPLGFFIDPTSKNVRIDRNSGTKMFSFEAFYEAIIQALDVWTKSHSGNLEKQLGFIRRYDTILSEGRIGKFRPKRADPGD
jgi:hypothetical protein